MHDFHLADQIYKTIMDYAKQNDLKKITSASVELGSIVEHGEEILPANLDFNKKFITIISNDRLNDIEYVTKKIKEIEPFCEGISGIWVGCTGIIDYNDVSAFEFNCSDKSQLPSFSAFLAASIKSFTILSLAYSPYPLATSLLSVKKNPFLALSDLVDKPRDDSENSLKDAMLTSYANSKKEFGSFH